MCCACLIGEKVASEYNEIIYSSSKPDGFSEKAAMRNRNAIFHRLETLINIPSLQSVLDVGVTADRANQSSNFFEAKFPYPERVTALSDQNASWMETGASHNCYPRSPCNGVLFSG